MIESIYVAWNNFCYWVKPITIKDNWYENIGRGDQQKLNRLLTSINSKVYQPAADTVRGMKVTHRNLYHYQSELEAVQQEIKEALKLIKTI